MLRLPRAPTHAGVAALEFHRARQFLLDEKAPALRGRRKPGNQSDLKRGTRVYFGFVPDAVPPNTVLGSITLQYGNMSPCARSIKFGDNHMDKVNRPIPGKDGPESYDESVVQFERTGSKRFRVALGSDRDLLLWRRRSKEQGMLYEMSGGREFGFYN